MLPSGLPAALNAVPDSTPFVREGAIPPVDPELIRRRVVGHIQIEPTVAVVVADRDAQAGAVGPGDARRLRHVGETAVALVAIQPVGDRTVGARTAVVTRPEAVGAELVVGQREVEIVRDEQIEIAIAVVVGERRAGAPQRIADAGGGGLTSVNVPSPLLRNSASGPNEVTNRSRSPSLS